MNRIELVKKILKNSPFAGIYYLLNLNCNKRLQYACMNSLFEMLRHDLWYIELIDTARIGGGKPRP